MTRLTTPSVMDTAMPPSGYPATRTTLRRGRTLRLTFSGPTSFQSDGSFTRSTAMSESGAMVTTSALSFCGRSWRCTSTCCAPFTTWAFVRIRCSSFSSPSSLPPTITPEPVMLEEDWKRQGTMKSRSVAEVKIFTTWDSGTGPDLRAGTSFCPVCGGSG